MELLQYKYHDDYVIQASSTDIGLSWRKFKVRAKQLPPERYCNYEKDDVISYVSALANMEGGHLVVGVEDKTLKIVGTDTYNYTTQQATLRLTNLCANLSSEGLDVEEFITEDTHKTVWVIHIPKHLPKLPVYAHNKAWQRIEDSLVIHAYLCTGKSTNTSTDMAGKHP